MSLHALFSFESSLHDSTVNLEMSPHTFYMLNLWHGLDDWYVSLDLDQDALECSLFFFPCDTQVTHRNTLSHLWLLGKFQVNNKFILSVSPKIHEIQTQKFKHRNSNTAHAASCCFLWTGGSSSYTFYLGTQRHSTHHSGTSLLPARCPPPSPEDKSPISRSRCLSCPLLHSSRNLKDIERTT